MKSTLKLVVFLFSVCAAVHGQVGPAAIAGPAYLKYSLRYAQTADFYGGSLGDQQQAIASGSLEYANGIGRLPFAMTYGGGYNWNISGRSYGNGFFENLLLSQGIVGRDWKASISDAASYRKQAPTTGFSGIPGTGEPIGGPNPAPPTSQTVLTVNTSTVDNVVTGEIGRQVSYATTISASGGSELMRYPDGNGIDTNGQSANVGLNRRIGARGSVLSRYSFNRFTYSGSPAVFEADTVVAGYKRRWNRSLDTSVSAGPYWITSNETTLVPTSIGISANASAGYQLRFGSVGLAYSHGITGGGGYYVGAKSDAVTANYTREFGTKITLELTGGYQSTSGLIHNGTTNGKYGAVQFSRKITRDLSLFGSYSGTSQTTSSSLPNNALSGLMQVISFGIGYTPREIVFRR
jgi:hypothetical protein